MEGGLRLRWLITFLVIISLHGSGWVSGTTSQENQAGGRRKLASREGFISLDCGLAPPSSYTDNATEITYTSDEGFIDTGIIYNVSDKYVNEYTYRYFRSVRNFPDGERNCYTLPVEEGNKYLIRAQFSYRNYDAKNQLPIFKLYLGVDEWATVNISDVSSAFTWEIIHKVITNEIDVCLINTGQGTPFISVLEVRRLNDLIYNTSEVRSLLLFNRYDLGSLVDETYLSRVKDDAYDRHWSPWTWEGSESINSSLVSSSLSISDYKLPQSVMATASTPANESGPLEFYIPIDEDPSQNFYIYMHFAEVMDLQGQIREFTISANKQEAFGGPLAPIKGQSVTRQNEYSISAITNKELSFSLERTATSAFPPLMNALEIYILKDFSMASTRQEDVDAMKMVKSAIKSAYAMSRNWQGDPCLPTDYLWHGLTCSRNTTPAIISLNLSSSNLSGDILPAFSSLKSLQSLDLSYNNLTGSVPEFFARLPSLTVLNLTGNNLTGSVPQAVLDKFKDGLLLGENPNLCQSYSCQGMKKKKTNFPILVPILSVIVIMIVVAASAIIIRKFKRRKNKAKTLKMATEYPKQGSMRSRTSEFTYAEVDNITNNFSQTIGRGGFGQVFLGKLANGTQVAVKVRSESSAQGAKAVQAEATLLTRVYHKNLVSLLGYCNDGINMALVYEYMSEGNLENKLSGGDTTGLSWKQRLQIGADAAQGLEYLHNGCKPPIVHRDMKSSNILLSEKLQAKISDFGISRDLGTETGASMSSTAIAGTPGYLDPEYQSTGVLNTKSDVYSFGIILLELITGQPAINPRGIHIVGWVTSIIERGDVGSIVDPRLNGDFNTNSAWKVLETALACVALKGMERPDMSLVVADLKECLEIEVGTSRENESFQEDSSPLVLNIELAPQAR